MRGKRAKQFRTMARLSSAPGASVPYIGIDGSVRYSPDSMRGFYRTLKAIWRHRG